MTQSSDPKTVIIDIEKLAQGSANPLEFELLQALLAENETYEPLEMFPGLRPTYLFEKLDQVAGSYFLPDAIRNKYTDSYIYTSSPVGLFYVADNGGVTPVELSATEEKELTTHLAILENFDVVTNNVEPLEKQLDRYSARGIKNAMSENVAEINRSVAAQATAEFFKNAYPLNDKTNLVKPVNITHNNITYHIYLKQNLLRREAKQKADEPARHHYESYDPAAFYVGLNNIRTLHKSTGVLKLTTDPVTNKANLQISTKHQRVVKIEHLSWADEKEKEEIKEQAENLHTNVLSKMNAVKSDDDQINLGFKKTEIVEGTNVTHIYNVMAYLDGVSLDNVISAAKQNQSDRKFLNNHRLDIMEQALQSLYDSIHQNSNWVHRDIKPGNFIMMYDENNDALKVQIIDFDDVLIPDSNAKPSGTPAYFSPELEVNSSFTQASDTFAMGLTLMSIYLGKEITKDNYKNELPSVTNDDFKGIFQQMLRENPDSRLPIKDVLKVFQYLRPNSIKEASSTSEIFAVIGKPEKKPHVEIGKQPSPVTEPASTASPTIKRQEPDSPKPQPAHSSPGMRKF